MKRFSIEINRDNGEKTITSDTIKGALLYSFGSFLKKWEVKVKEIENPKQEDMIVNEEV